MSLSSRSSLIATIILLLLAVSALFALDRYGKSRRSWGAYGPLGSPQAAIRLTGRPEEAVAVWKDARCRGRLVLYVSGRWPSFVPGERLSEELYRDYPLRLYNTARRFEAEALDSTTFLYVAALDGIARGIVAVLPEEELARQREAARTSKDGRVDSRGVYLPREGYPRWFTTASLLAPPSEPVLLYVGASYFVKGDPDTLYRQLSAAGVRSDLVILCREEGGTATAREAERLERFARLAGFQGGGDKTMGGTP
ncbi:hypothetical protein L4X63_03290 [Geomonas sp. Red32]|uniref:hypothetical protein n=1 Tax=Geomonas sp. Red32 TaxID=2912856 RepID=UPI00202CDA39|nr:hypothetical protein [Geomonas sp. Red32]MCM0080608.1 hypothetical protein [Geomonas sp. Red32]